MIAIIILSLISIGGLLFSLKKEGIFQKIITCGLVLSIMLTLTENTLILTFSILIILFLAITSSIYSLTIKDLPILERLTIGLTGLILTIGTFAQIQHYPGQAILRLILIIPIILFILTIIKYKMKQPKEFGFMLIWISISIIQMLKMII